MNACEIVEYVLVLEKRVHDSLLKLHKCASGDEGKSEDPHVRNLKLYINNYKLYMSLLYHRCKISLKENT